MLPEHFETIREGIKPFDTAVNRQHYRDKEFSDKRYRWDLLWAATRKCYQPTTKWVCDVLYPYLDDTHIDTALRRIVPPLNPTPN